VFTFDNHYAKLPERFYRRVAPAKASAPRVIAVNRPLAELLGVDPAALDAAVLSGNAVPDGADPIALAYAGHQFGVFVPQLGDGRAILLGEVTGKDGVRRDIQLKGAGRTPFSRGGDGRAALGPVLREYVVSEAMHALGIPTTRALAAVSTGDTVVREELLQGAVLTRVASSHIRVGTFQFFAAREDHEAIAALASHALARHYPSATGGTNDALALLERVTAAQASLVARWLGVGFVHGVMNTDNTSIAGETIDYGPCAFLDEYDPRKRFSSIDHHGRYAFASQPRIALWNLARLGEALLSAIHENEEEAARLATATLDRFGELFSSAYLGILREKLGLTGDDDEGDGTLAEDLLERLHSNYVDYTLFFRRLARAAEDDAADAEIAAMFEHEGAYRDWAERWRDRLGREPACDRVASMRRANPAFIPRNHRIEQMIAAARAGDFAPFERLLSVLARPHDDQPEHEELTTPPLPEERVVATFCGT
jgi:uncharacterized protein YdiU (UPF0061 family)